jgi:ribonuclease D
VVAALEAVPAYAVDTEFHRERTYYPTLALVQIAWPGGLVLIDPLAVDLSPLSGVLAGPGVAVMHAASQDIEVLQRACGTIPSTLFDTQVAAGFLGFSTPSLTSLVGRVIGVDLPKANRLTDWLRRPLAPDQQRYAACDVVHLLELTELLRAELAATGRLAWADAECEELRTRRWGPPDPEDAWLRLKEARALRGRSRGIAQAVAAWRERRAAEADQPVRFVLSDMALVGIANAAPKDLEQLRRVRGLDQRHARGTLGREILAAVEQGRSVPEAALKTPRRDELDRDLRPALALLTAWVSQLSRELRLDAGLLATRSDLTAFLQRDPNARLASGWRAELVGGPAERLVAGELALAFDGTGALVLERRSGEAVTSDLRRPTATWVEGA